MTTPNAQVAFARGDGIGPEIMDAVLGILKAAGARIDFREVVVGEKAYAAGETAGISAADLATLSQSRAFLKAPLNTPQGKGFSSVNVTIRKLFDQYINLRPSVSLAPFIAPKNGAGKVDIVLFRENIEDLYAGIEHRPTPDVAIGRKVITRSESERVIRAAFEYARQHGREKVTAISKDNIQKFTDGVNFHAVFDEVAKDYPEIKAEFYIADIGIARLGARPHDFDVVVTQNMYGDIASDVIGEALGSIGLSGSANIGDKFAMFEAVHGTAPDIAGKGWANPSGLLMAAVMMLDYIGQPDVAEKIHNAWLKTIEDGIHTGEIFKAGTSTQKAGTADFAAAVTARLGQKPAVLKPVDYAGGSGFRLPVAGATAAPSDDFIATGVDIHVQHEGAPQDLADKAMAATGGLTGVRLAEIRTARGDTVWPQARAYFSCDYLTLRFAFDNAAARTEPEKQKTVASILAAFADAAGEVKWREVCMLTKNARTLENNYR